MIADEEKYQRLIRYNKIMITLVGVICVIISGYVFIEMKAIIIPNIGSIIATIFPITFAFVQFDNIIIVIWIAVVLLAIQVLIGNVLEPKVVGKSMGISPVVVLFSLIFWGYVWGIVGMVLAVPDNDTTSKSPTPEGLDKSLFGICKFQIPSSEFQIPNFI